MDFDALNALSNLVNQQSNRENKSELIAIRKQLAAEAKKPQCPHCGGASEKGFGRCKNCGQEVIWCGRFVGKPGTGELLEVANRQYKLEIKRKRELKKRKQEEEDNAPHWWDEPKKDKLEKEGYDFTAYTPINCLCAFLLFLVLMIVFYWWAFLA